MVSPSFKLTDHTIVDYSPPCEEDVNKALDLVSKKLIGKITADDGEEGLAKGVFESCRFAITHYDEWSESTKKIIDLVVARLDVQAQDQPFQTKVAENKCASSIQKELLTIFIGENRCKREVSETLSRNHDLLAVAQIDPPYCYYEVLPGGKRELKIVDSWQKLPISLTPEQRIEIFNRSRQIDLIEKFLVSFDRDHYSLLFSDDNRCEEQKKRKSEKFRKVLRPVIPKILFRQPKIVGKHEKVIVVNVVNRLNKFFAHYNSVKNGEENALLLAIGRGLEGEEERSFITEGLEEWRFTILLQESIEKALCAFFTFIRPEGSDSEDVMDQFIAFSVARSFADICNDYLLSPYLFCLLFDNLFLEDIDLSSPYLSPPDFSSCDRSDKKFNNDVGDKAVVLLQEILQFADANWFVRNGVKKFLSKELVGPLIQQGINHVLGTDSAIQPLQLLEKIFYKKGVPVLKEALKAADGDEKEQYKRNIEEQVTGRLMNLLKSKLSSLLEHIPGLEKLCKTLSNKLFNLTQNRRLLILLLCYFLKGIEESFVSLKYNPNIYSDAPERKF